MPGTDIASFNLNSNPLGEGCPHFTEESVMSRTCVGHIVHEWSGGLTREFMFFVVV